MGTDSLAVALPSGSRSTPAALCGLILQRLAVIVQAQRQAFRLGGQYATVSVTDPDGADGTVEIADFFDHTMADTVQLCADAGSAERDLRAAEAEFVHDRKIQFRRAAEVSLRASFERVEARIRDRDAQTFKIIGHKDVALHYQALQLAALAATAANATENSAATPMWIERTKTQFTKAGSILLADREVKVESYNRRYGKGINASKVFGIFDPYPADSERSARTDAERAIANAELLERNMEFWGVWVRALRS